MTTPTPHEGSPNSDSPPTARRYDSSAAKTIASVLEGPTGLQTRYLRGEPRARGELAQLRAAVTAPPGSNPAIWHLTQVPVPPHTGDDPTPDEIAAHTALTLYAIHQQSRPDPQHLAGLSLGHAARQLVGRGDKENESFRKRFNALVTSSTIGELRYHLKSFTSLLRSNSVSMSYALLAEDLVRFQRPGGAAKVRRTWARDFASLAQPTPTNSTPSSQNMEN